MNLDIRVVGTSSQLSLYKVLKLKQFFRKSKVVTGKTPLFVVGSICTPHFICLKGALSGLRQLLGAESSLKMKKNVFSFHLSSSFRSQDI